MCRCPPRRTPVGSTNRLAAAQSQLWFPSGASAQQVPTLLSTVAPTLSSRPTSPSAPDTATGTNGTVPQALPLPNPPTLKGSVTPVVVQPGHSAVAGHLSIEETPTARSLGSVCGPVGPTYQSSLKRHTSPHPHSTPPAQHTSLGRRQLGPDPALKCTSRGPPGSLLSTSLPPHLAHRAATVPTSYAVSLQGLKEVNLSIGRSLLHSKRSFCTSVSPGSRQPCLASCLVAPTPYLPTTCPGSRLPTSLCICSPSRLTPCLSPSHFWRFSSRPVLWSPRLRRMPSPCSLHRAPSAPIPLHWGQGSQGFLPGPHAPPRASCSPLHSRAQTPAPDVTGAP